MKQTKKQTNQQTIQQKTKNQTKKHAIQLYFLKVELLSNFSNLDV
jgi:hypothetical protein